MKIEEIQSFIREQIGLELSPCDSFPGLRVHNGSETYYNFLTEARYAESYEVAKLIRLSINSETIYRVEPNGPNRVAVFFKASRH